MSSAKHTPDAGVEMSFRIGQCVRHRDYKGRRVTGVVRGLSIDSDGSLQVDIALDAPIVIPKSNAADREISIYRQCVPAHELAPFDDRDELVATLLAALREALEFAEDQSDVIDGSDGAPQANDAMRLAQTLQAAIAKAGAAS